jgi:thioredoxin reductase (NADPH)
MENIVIIGSGPAGLTAAIYAARANLQPIVIAGYQSGGQLMLTTEVENYPGFEEGILGPELIEKMRKQAERFGARFIYRDAIKVDFSKKDEKTVYMDNGVLKSKAIIVATGASAKWLNVENEEKFRGRGVSTCATCDGAFFKNKIVAVVGGGDTAMEEALFLTRFANKVYIIHRRDTFRASKAMQAKVFANNKIEIIWNTVVVKINGEDKVQSVTLQSTVNASQTHLELDGVFVAIGHEPNTKFLEGQLELDEKGYIKAYGPNQTMTNVEGVFVAGDVFDHTYRQAITAAGSGCKAAIDAEKYLTNNE